MTHLRQHDQEKPGFWKKLGQKTKAIFVTENTDTETLENLQATELDNIIAEYNKQLRYVEEAIKTNAPDFHPSIEVWLLHNLRDQVDQLRAEEITLRESLLQTVLQYFPVLLVLFPEESAIWKQLRDVLHEVQIGTFSHDAQSLFSEIEHQKQNTDHKMLQVIQQLIQQQSEKRLATQEALRQTLLSYQTTIHDLSQKQQTLTTQHKKPELLEQEIIESIKNYEWWDVRYSETPASDTFSAKMLMQKLQEYKERYASQELQIIQQQQEIQQAIETALQECVEVITSAHHHVIQQQNKLREQYTKTMHDTNMSFIDKTTLFKKTRTAVLALRSTFVQDIWQTKQFLAWKVAPEVSEKIDSFFVLDRDIIQRQQDALIALRHDFDQAFHTYEQTSNVQNLNKLRALQKVLVQDYQNFISRVQEYQELEHTLVASGQQLAFIETLNAVPHRPQLPFEATKELGWTIEQLEELYGGFATHIWLPSLTLTNNSSQNVFSTDDAEQLHQRLRASIFEKSVDVQTDTTPYECKKIRPNFIQGTQEVVVEDSIPPELKVTQQALRAKWPNEKLPDGRDFRDACDALMHDPTCVKFGGDAYWDTYTEFVEAKVQCRHTYLRTDGMQQGEYEHGKNDYIQFADKQLISFTTSSGTKACVYKNTIDQQKPTWKKQMDTDCYAKGYTRQTKAHTDNILSSLARRLSITYDITHITNQNQQVIKAYMYLKWALGRERLNSEFSSSKNWDIYWQRDHNSISRRLMVHCHDSVQAIFWDSCVNNIWSIPLVRWCSWVFKKPREA
jgi:hypothetical protein